MQICCYIAQFIVEGFTRFEGMWVGLSTSFQGYVSSPWSFLEENPLCLKEAEHPHRGMAQNPDRYSQKWFRGGGCILEVG